MLVVDCTINSSMISELHYLKFYSEIYFYKLWQAENSQKYGTSLFVPRLHVV